MTVDDSVTDWIAGVKMGDKDAAKKLYERYFERLANFAKPRMHPRYRALANEEDMAQSVLNLFYQGAQRGRFDYVHNRDELWGLLVRITAHRVIDYYRRFGRSSGSPSEVREADIAIGGKTANFGNFMAEEASVTPDDVFMFASMQEEVDRLMAGLRNDEWRQIAWLKLAGHSIEEIAESIEKSRRSVERKLKSIRTRWEEMLKEPDES